MQDTPTTARNHKKGILLIVVLVAGVIAALWIGRRIYHRLQSAGAAGSTVVVLEDCDDDFKTPPFEDRATIFDPNGKLACELTKFNICQTVGGCRSLSVAPNGDFFVVCENVANKLSAFRTKTGEQLWSIDGGFTAAAISRSGETYALTSLGTIYGDEIKVFDSEGKLVRETTAGGFDVALDEERQSVWLVGANIRKLHPDLTSVVELDPIPWCAVSVDINSDGSVWVAEREHSQVTGSTNRILKIAPHGQILQTLNLAWSPSCLRVDRTDNSVWVTGWEGRKPASGKFLEFIEKRTVKLPLWKGARDFLTRTRYRAITRKYDRTGKLLISIRHGGQTLDLDRRDGSVWIASEDAAMIYHYSSTGLKLGVLSGVSEEEKYIAVVP